MSTLIIEGGHRLAGVVDVEGNKNAALPLMAATLLTREPCTLANVPRIADVEVMARLLLDLGAEVEGIGSTTLRIQCREVTNARARPRAGRPPARLGAAARPAARAHAAAPGWRRRVATSRRGGPSARISMRWRRWARCSIDGPGHRLEAPRGLQPASIYLDEASVTGTETALLAAAAAPGISEIRHAACEPHVVELCEFLRDDGCRHHRRGLAHDPRRGRHAGCGSAAKTLYGDYIEAGSWAVVGAITGGEMEIRGAREVDMEVVTSTLRKMAVQCRQRGDELRRASRRS